MAVETKFIVSNGVVKPLSLSSEFLRDNFPPAVYSIGKDMGGYYLQYIEDKFEIPAKIYGSTNRRSKKVLKTFERRSGTTGILLTGDKGTGKSLLAKVVANKAIKKGYPVIRIQSRHYGEPFLDFIQSLGDCVLIFDEFYKTYYDESEETDYQNELLSLFDGMANSKKLIILTENEYRHISELYKNRPSRVYYAWQYAGVEEEIIEGYCKDHLKYPEIIPDVVTFSRDTPEFSFDILQSIVEELNANYKKGDTVEEVVADLNLEGNMLEPYFIVKDFKSGKFGGNQKIKHELKKDSIIKIEHFPNMYVETSDSKENHDYTYHFNFKGPDVKFQGGIYEITGERGAVIKGELMYLPKGKAIAY